MFPFCHFFWTAFNIENTELLNYSKPDPKDVNPSEKTTQLARKSSVGPLNQEQPQEQTSSSSDAHTAHGSPSFRRATPEELDHSASPQITHERLVELERKLSAMLAAQTERDRRVAQLTEELVQKVALLEQAEANAAEAKKRAGLEQCETQAKLDELLLSRDYVLQKASHVTEANERSQQALAEMGAELEARKSELAAVHLRLTDVENGWAKSKVEADTLRAQIAAGLVNTDEVTSRLTGRVRAIEAKMVSPRARDEKSFDMMECSNED